MKIFFLSLGLFIASWSHSQDTFSIVAIDSITGEVGSAGASCVNLNSFPGITDHFLGELFPGLGAINSQAWYQPGNQTNARHRMNAGDTPEEIIAWLQNNDIQNQPELRQYGIVAMINGSVMSAGHTGTSTDDYKGHILGSNYAIQGNILSGPEVLEKMEENFLNTEGSLSCKLMAAMQGANTVGADSRCAIYGTSSLFAFLKVAQPDDTFGFPSSIISVRADAFAPFEPIDSLQVLFDQSEMCEVSETENLVEGETLRIYPNPAQDVMSISPSFNGSFTWEIVNVKGQIVLKGDGKGVRNVDILGLLSGMYNVNLYKKGIFILSKPLIKN